VQRHEYELGRRPAVLGLDVGGDAAAVVDDLDTAVGQQGDVDVRGVARHRLVDRVVDDFVDEVMQPRRAGRTDVHPRAFAHRFEAFENGDVLGAVRLCAIVIAHAGGSCRRPRSSAEKLLVKREIEPCGEGGDVGDVGPKLTKSR
jgi:hypothetical protein